METVLAKILVRLALWVAVITPWIVVGETVYPQEEWVISSPAEQGLNGGALDQLASDLGGMGCIVRNGYVVKQWRIQRRRGDWGASSGPVFSTLLFFAIEEGRLAGVHERLSQFYWELDSTDRSLEFYHLLNMTDGYSRPEPPGAVWHYNDLGLNLFQITLFDRVYNAPGSFVLLDPERLGALKFQDYPVIAKSTRHLVASTRDYARLAWFWCRQGEWDGVQLLPRHYFQRFAKPLSGVDLPASLDAAPNDYLGVEGFGAALSISGNDGAGRYGSHWWFNAPNGDGQKAKTWPDAPDDTFMAISSNGYNAVMIPSLNLVMVTSIGRWGEFDPGDESGRFNGYVKALVGAVVD